ncbi:MAG: hypothetical protein NT115_10570 [Proteobacteria bacterium]|nr:hypothetical protein [Pseudomonadota bacterium]
MGEFMPLCATNVFHRAVPLFIGNFVEGLLPFLCLLFQINIPELRPKGVDDQGVRPERIKGFDERTWQTLGHGL